VTETKNQDLQTIEARYHELIELISETTNVDQFFLELLSVEKVMALINDMFKTQLFTENYLKEQDAGNLEIMFDNLVSYFHRNMIEEIQNSKQVPSLPTITEVISWIESMNLILFEQIFNSEYIRSVIHPSLVVISETLIEEVEKTQIQQGEE